jgi:2-oxoisovalerate dehydrogenase E2 component (dihydrolipoyl transacylase)
MATLNLSVVPALRFLRGVIKPAPGSIALQRFSPFLSVRSSFHSSARHQALLSQKLTDVGEGTTEAQIIQWYVQEGARVEEWGNLCEVQTDKASVDISSRHTGVVKKLHFEADATVKVGEALLDIEVEEDAQDMDPEKEEEVKEVKEDLAPKELESIEDEDEPTEEWMGLDGGAEDKVDLSFLEKYHATSPAQSLQPASKSASLATPAVRGLLKEHKIAIEDVRGTGKDGRVLKEDVQSFIAERIAPPAGPTYTATRPQQASLDAKQTETPQRLTPVQSKMFQTMTTSLSIPHFLYSDTINVTRLAAVRKSLNETGTSPKLSFLPFAIKAVSLALYKYPILNARLDTTSNPHKPQLLMRSVHNIGIAMDTPGGLVVPVIQNVGARSIYSIAEEIARLAELGQSGKLSTADLSGGTITISNIGSIGGDVVAPIIVDGQLAIMGMGKVKAVPVFAKDGITVEKAEMMGVSWSADHRVVDGATMARAAKVVQSLLEEPLKMMLEMT